MIHKFSVLILFGAHILLSACATYSITHEKVQKHLSVVIPDGAGQFPVVIFYQGTGGDTRRAEAWASWFKTMGVASAIVDNARMRNRSKNPAGSMYTEDGALAWDLLKDNQKIDTTRFALMGFSRGGQQAMEAGPHFKGKRVPPSFVFALYPGGWENDSCGAPPKKPTEVHIFFGDQDDVDKYVSISPSCRHLAEWRDNVEFHGLSGATHGYDDIYSYTFVCCGGRQVHVAPNPEAIEKTKAIIEKVIKSGWNL